MRTFYETFEAPPGAFTVVADESGAVVATAFGGREALSPGIRAMSEHASGQTAAARHQIEEYFAGRRTEFELELSPAASEFQRRFREELGKVALGSTSTYGKLAVCLGSSARAVGRANATNPLCVIVPCHRVLGADGSLTGYAYGVAVKRWLLEHEAKVAGLQLAMV